MGMAGSNLHFRTTCVGMLTLLAAYSKFLWVLIFFRGAATQIVLIRILFIRSTERSTLEDMKLSLPSLELQEGGINQDTHANARAPSLPFL